MKDKKNVLKPVLIRLAVYACSFYLLLCAAVYFKQGSIVFVPTVGEPERNPADIGLNFEDLLLDSGNEKIHAWYIPANADKGTVLICHGNAGNLGHRMSTISIWNRLGMNIMIFDYQGYGKSSGSPGEEASYSDVEACFNWLKEQKKDKKPLIIHGRSLGGGPACWAAVNLQFDGLILESTFTSISDMGSHQFPFLPVRLICNIDFENRERVGKIKIPVLVFHGKEDEIIPYKMGKQLAEAADVDLQDLEGDHNSGFRDTESYPAKLKEFIFSLSGQEK